MAGIELEGLRGAVYYPPWWWAARRLASWDNALSAVTTLGAAFLVLAASKPVRTRKKGCRGETNDF